MTREDYEQSSYTGDALYVIHTHTHTHYTVRPQSINLACCTCHNQGFPALELGLCIVALDEFLFHDHVHVGVGKRATRQEANLGAV